MPSGTTELREQLATQVGAPFGIEQVERTFGSSASAADFLGLRRGRAGDPDRQEKNRRRSTFQQSYGRWVRGTRRPSGGWWERLRSAAERSEIIQRVRDRGLLVTSWQGVVDVYGNDVRERSITEQIWLAPDELEDANGYNFFRGVARADWTEAARAVSTTWFMSYVGNDLAGGDATWGSGELTVVIP